MLPTAPDDPAQELRALLEAGRYSDALELYRRLGDTLSSRRPEVQLLAATAATRLGELAVGAALAEQALQVYRGRGDRDGSMRALNLLGAIHWERGRMPEAERCFADALRLARQIQDSPMLARASNNLASVAHLQGRSDEAAELYRGALLAHHRQGAPPGTAEPCWRTIGRVIAGVPRRPITISRWCTGRLATGRRRRTRRRTLFAMLR